jgi:hypothetical protein
MVVRNNAAGLSIGRKLNNSRGTRRQDRESVAVSALKTLGLQLLGGLTL